ncbi:putative expansin-B2 [Arachis duranensis]|uniref:Expansin-B2 n=1 Tax=Arachis duranensis TaxID=130453 RepID=A0A9C6TRE8_ARADU|nr:putative expansin-B2 [Arachis duranensis]
MKVHTFTLVVLCSMLLSTTCYCINPKFFNPSKVPNDEKPWDQAQATWYGTPDGAGSESGACSYGKTVESPPISKLTAAVGHYIFRQGYGCGACYEVKCTDNAACSEKPVTVVVSDECPSCSGYHFNLSGAAFASIANPGQQDILHKLGQVNLQYRRVSCSFGNSIAVRIGENSRPPTYMEASIEYVNGDAEYIDLEVRDQSFLTVSRVGGATWSFFFAGYNLQPPMTLTLTQRYSNGTKGKTIQLPNIIPVDWKIGQLYQSKTNF